MSNSLRRLRTATPFTSSGVEQHEPGLRPRLVSLSRFTSWPSFRATARPRRNRDRSDCASASGPSADPFTDTSFDSSRCHGHTPATRRCIGAALSAAHPLQNEHAKPASTFNMGRRIMAERRRHRRERQRAHRPHARGNANSQMHARCDETLRAFVRVLARQAAREFFETQLKRHSLEIH